MHKNLATGGEIMKKRIISLLMALLMLTSLLPAAVWAEGDAPEQAAATVTDDGAAEQEPAATPETPETPEAPEAPAEPEQTVEPEQPMEPEADAEPEDNGIALYSAASGQCGNNLTWTLDNGVLTISGKGAMWNGDDGWYGFCDVLDQADEVTSVVVESGVTSIAYEAFRWLESMTSVTIPKTVTSIGCNAFSVGCDALTTIKYDGTTSQWKRISSTLSLPLATNVVCSNGTITPALSGTCGKNVSYSISDDGVLTIRGTGAMNNFTYKSDISDCPWHGVRYALKKIVVEDGVTSIGSYAFSFDVHVTDVTLPSSLKTIGNDAFFGCHGLTSVVIPEGVTTIGAYAFEQCTSIETITVPASATELGNRAFITWEYYDGSYHFALTDIYYGGSRQQWYDAGGGDAALVDVPVHFNSATGNIIDSGTCGANAFWKLDKDYTLTIYGTGAMYDYYPDNNNYLTSPWISFDVKKIDVQEGITSIGAYALCRLKTATEVSLPSTLTTIGRNALYDIGVSSLVIPDNVVSIGDFAFNGCDNLKTITLPAGLQKIGHCFIECDALKTINFKGTMDQWLACGGGWSIFPAQTQVVCASGTMNLSGTCGDKLIWTLDNNGKLTVSGTGAMYDYDYDYENDAPPVVPWAKYRSMIRSTEIGNGVTYIGAWAFEDTNITSLTIPGSVKTIGRGSFSNNRYLVNLTFSSGLKHIESMAFAGSHLSTVVIPDGVTSIGEGAFSYCVRGDYINGEWVPSGLTSITIPVSVISIGKDMLKTYDEYDLLATVNFGGTQEQWNAIGGKDAGVPDTAKLNCATAVASGKCGDNVTYTLSDDGILTISGKGAVTQIPWQNSTVKEVIVLDGVTSLCGYAFTNQPVTRVTLPDSLTSIGVVAFAGCQIEELYLPRNLKTVGGEAFTSCTKLTYLDMDENCAATLDDMAFAKCTVLKTIHLSANITLGEGVFVGCSNLEKVIFEGSGKQWLDLRAGLDEEIPLECRGGGFGSGKYGDNLTWELDSKDLLTISGSGRMYDYQDTEDSTPEGQNSPWTVAADGTFLFWYVHEIRINYGVTHIGNTAFKYCHYVDEITVPSSVTSIGESAFRNCKNLRSVTIPDTVTSIGENAFLLDENLSVIYFSGSKEQWNNLNPSSLGLSEGFTAAGGYANVTFIKPGVIVTGGDAPEIRDVASLYDHLTGQAKTGYTPRQKLAADVNRDGTLDVYDLQLLYEAVAQGTEL